MKIGPYALRNNVFVAPMAGVTDRPYRQLCKRLGAGYAVSEMAASNPKLWASVKTSRRIDHAGESRIREMTPPQMLPWASGPARRYEHDILDEIVPGLARDFNVNVGRLGLGGSSMGGLATLWIALRHPDRFNRLLVMSPSVWVRQRAILKLARSRRLDPATRVWLGAGVHEGHAVLADTHAVRDRLASGGVGDIQLVEDPDGRHAEDSWARQLPHALTWLYR